MAKLEGEFRFDNPEESEEVKVEEEKIEPSAEHTEELPPPHTNEAAVERVPIKKKIRFYTSIMEYPQGVTFDAQEEDEEIVLLLRRSFVTNVPWIVVIVLLSFLPALIAILPLPPIFGSISPITYSLMLIFFYLILFGAVLLNFALWYFHIGLITNKRIIDVDLHGILSRHVAETRISLVQDVSYKQIGFLRSLFHYGDVFVQTAGSHQNVEFDRVPRPVFISQVIGDLVGNVDEEN